jgi:asparagine synthase (glutamine-hydrolysing)
MKAIEMQDKLQVSIAVPIYLCMRFAKSLGFSEIVFGQGADELFGGYKRYEDMDYRELEFELRKDLMEIGEKNLVRDNKIAYANEIKLHTPYLQWDLIRVALSIPVELKVKRNGDVVRKFILREVAKEVIPREIAYRDKKAIQYSTKTAKMLRKVLKD